MIFKRILMASALMLASGCVAAFEPVDIATYFPAVAQGHHGNNNNTCHQITPPQFRQYNTSRVNGTQGNALQFCGINSSYERPPLGCDSAIGGDGRYCTVTNSDIRGLATNGNNEFLSSNGTAGSIGYCNNGDNLTLGGSGNQYGSVALYARCTVSASPNFSEYRFKSLEIGSGARLVLTEGDYWVDRLSLVQGGEIVLQGNARIFVNQSTTISDSLVNISARNSLLLIAYNNLTLTGTSQVTGYVYADQTISLNNSAVINGRTTSRYLFMEGQSRINDSLFAPPPLTCFNDDFSSGSLSGDWVVKTSSGSFTPSIVGGRLRLTQAVGDQSTSTTYQRLFPAANNLVTITFNHYAYGGNGADGMAVVFSDAKVTPQPGAFGGPLGYGFKPRIPGFAGGWLGIGFDEYGNYSGEGGTYNVGRRRQAVAIRGSGSGTSGYRYLKGTCNDGTTNINTNCLNPGVDGNGGANHKYQLTIDSRISGQSMVKVERDSGSGYVTLIDGFNAQNQSGQAQVPSDFLLSLTGSTGGLTNVHELDNVQICALRSNPVGVQIDHFQLDHSGQALTCNPETVTVKACADAACNTLITDPVTATLSLTPTSASNGWIGGNTVTFSGGSTKVQLRNNTPTAVTIGVSGSTPTTKPFSTTLCKAGAGTPSAAACTLNFADSGFFFDVPDTYSNQPQTVTIKAIKKSDVTKQCVPGFASQTKSVKFWSSYISPTGNPYNSQMSVNSSAIGASQGAATPLSLAFNDQGQSTITVNYPDAGKVQLDARYDGTGSEAGLVMLGADQFVARPVGLCITPPQGVCAAGDSSCPVFKKAGETFQVDIKAMAWESANDGDICVGNQTTPNFALTNIALGTQLVAPIPGQNAQVGTASYNHSNGMDSNNLNKVTQSVSEVGVFRMTATPPANGYFNYTIPSAQSQPVGRFVPWDYSLSGGFITPACNVFTYMSQPFASGFVLTARNLQQGTTQNYQGAFAKGVAEMVAANALDGVARDKRITLSPSLSWASGIASVNQQSPLGLNTRFDRAASPEAPFATLSFGLKVDDQDGGNTRLAMMNMNAGVVGDCSKSGQGCNAVRLGTQKLLYGRLLAGKNRGVNSAELPVTLLMQRFEPGGWVTNDEDSCTQLSLANDGFDPLPGESPIDKERKISFNSASSSYQVTGNVPRPYSSTLTLSGQQGAASSATAKKGEIIFHFSAPNADVVIPYRVDLAKQPSSPTWLSDPTSLQGEARFDSSRGNDRIIYRREVLQ
ncbi:DUF6701 domain-containing protein [Aeromonas fluvialis]|uniref:DUF6701 domain-containing protein n=1 Tax=Aeromonas fluvialis TaxID=591962 RepID=UPI000A5FA7B8|nr:DUF6701 domain-containing protein [Aeromonas fluvialis]